MISSIPVNEFDRATALIEEENTAKKRPARGPYKLKSQKLQESPIAVRKPKEPPIRASARAALEVARSQRFRPQSLEIGVECITMSALAHVKEVDGVIDTSRDDWLVYIDARKIAGSNVKRYYELRNGAVLLYDVHEALLSTSSLEAAKCWWRDHPPVAK